MLPMPGLAWQGKAAPRMHEFKNLAKATHEIRAPRVQGGPLKNTETSPILIGFLAKLEAVGF
jgi:hypothetical protein